MSCFLIVKLPKSTVYSLRNAEMYYNNEAGAIIPQVSQLFLLSFHRPDKFTYYTIFL